MTFARLFTLTALAASFDDAVAQDAANGRVNRAFATLAATELGLFDLLKADGQPVGKAAFLSFAADYRAMVRAGKQATIRARQPRVWIGVALDAITLGLDPSANVVGGEDAWMTLTEPKARTAKAKAPVLADDASDDEGEAAPAPDAAPVADGLTYADGFAAGVASVADTDTVDIAVPALVAGLIDACSADALTLDEIDCLMTALTEARTALAPAPAQDEAPDDLAGLSVTLHSLQDLPALLRPQAH